MNHDRRPGSRSERRRVLFFGLTTWVVAAVLGVVMIGATLVGLLLGRRIGRSGDTFREPLGVVQGALIGFMGLVLAFGLSLALGRYESRRADTVDEANAIGTTYLRAQTLPPPPGPPPAAAPPPAPTPGRARGAGSRSNSPRAPRSPAPPSPRRAPVAPRRIGRCRPASGTGAGSGRGPGGLSPSSPSPAHPA